MAIIRTFMVVLFLITAAAGLVFTNPAHAASCEAILGQWMWFIGGEVTVNRDGTFTQQSGNAGTWECTDPARGQFTFRWRDGGFVNSLAVSREGQGLTSLDQSQWYVTAQRSGPAPSPQPPLVRKEDCCREEYACEIKRIQAEFEQKSAQCRGYAGNAPCFREAVSTKASGGKAAGEKLRQCYRADNPGAMPPERTTGNQAPSGGLSTRDLPPPPSSSDEFNSNERTENFSQGCQPCEVITSGQDTFPPEPEPKPFKLSAEEEEYPNPVQDVEYGAAKKFILNGKANDWDPFFKAVFGAIDQSWKRESSGSPYSYPVGANYNITLSPGSRPPLAITDIRVEQSADSEKLARALKNASLSGITPPSFGIDGKKISFRRSTFGVGSSSQQDQAHYIEVDGVIRRYVGPKIPGARAPRNF